MKYFTINELCWSETASKYKIKNTPTEEIKEHLSELVENVLDPLREAWGGPIIVSSGYRFPELNQKVGGSKTSSHMSGYAVDLVPENGEIERFFNFVKNSFLISEISSTASIILFITSNLILGYILNKASVQS